MPELRIVSLIASATEIVNELGLLPWLVGRSHECDYPAAIQSLPVCTRPRFAVTGNSREIDDLVKGTLANALSVYQVFDDVLEALQPTHIITQAQCEVCAVSLRDVERSVACRLASKPRIISLEPNLLADIWNDIAKVAISAGLDPDPFIENLRCRIEKARRPLTPAPRVACIEWLEPLMAAGNWMPELVEMAGGVNLFGEVGKHSPWMTWDELVAADPDVIMVAACGFDIPRTQSEMHWIIERSEWPRLKAVRENRVYVTDGNQFFNRPGPRVVESFEILTEILTGRPAAWSGTGYIKL